MDLHLHSYGLRAIGAGGAPINYSEVHRLLSSSWKGPVKSHDLFRAISDDGLAALARELRLADIVVSNAGPYAHIYHYLRERFGGRYRIIRDVRTAAWAPYLAQEWLCAKLTRPGDLVIFPSEYARGFFLRVFDHITLGNSRVLYPFADHLPRPTPRTPSSRLRIGYLGRLSLDKNLPFVFELAGRLASERDTELQIAGPFYPPISGLSQGNDLYELAGTHGLAGGRVLYQGALAPDSIWDFLSRIDVLYFPSASSHETFGRVIAEAGHAGIPVVASNFAAAPELLPHSQLVPLEFTVNRTWQMRSPFPFGTPDTAVAASLMLSEPVPVNFSGAEHYQGRTFIQTLAGDTPEKLEPPRLATLTRSFLGMVRIEGIPMLSSADAMEGCRRSVSVMQALFSGEEAVRKRQLDSILPVVRGCDVGMLAAQERLANSNAWGVLRNAVLVNLALDFDPTITLIPERPIYRDPGANLEDRPCGPLSREGLR